MVTEVISPKRRLYGELDFVPLLHTRDGSASQPQTGPDLAAIAVFHWTTSQGNLATDTFISALAPLEDFVEQQQNAYDT